MSFKPQTRGWIVQWIGMIDGAKLECDGMSRCLSTLLSWHNISHKAYQGSLTVDGVGRIPLHFWIELPNQEIIDLRARMWLGVDQRVPHGLFKRGSDFSYKKEIDHSGLIELSPAIFECLCGHRIDEIPL